jgi:hypothetical protein
MLESALVEVLSETSKGAIRAHVWSDMHETHPFALQKIRWCHIEHETITFGRRRNDSMYRMAIFLVWRNDIELRREKRCRSTPAMLIGPVSHPCWHEGDGPGGNNIREDASDAPSVAARSRRHYADLATDQRSPRGWE